MMRSTSISLFVLMVITTACNQSYPDHNEIKDLSGTWKFQLDPDNTGMRDQWFSKELFRNKVLAGDSFSMYMSSVVHPNEKGHQIITDELIKHFQ